MKRVFPYAQHAPQLVVVLPVSVMLSYKQTLAPAVVVLI